MRKLNAVMNAVLEYCLAFLMSAIVILVFSQVVLRFFERSLIWVEELGRYLFVWLVFLGSALGVNKGAHLGIDLLVTRLQPEKKRRLDAVLSVLLILFFCVVEYYSCKVLPIWNGKVSAALEIPMSAVFLALPVSFMLIILRLASRLFYFEEVQ